MRHDNDIKAPDGFLLGGKRLVRADGTILFQRGWWKAHTTMAKPKTADEQRDCDIREVEAALMFLKRGSVPVYAAVRHAIDRLEQYDSDHDRLPKPFLGAAGRKFTT